MAKVVAQDSKVPQEHPTVRVQLGGGNVHLSKKGSFEWDEGEAQAKSSKDRGVDETKRSLGVRRLVGTRRLTYPTGHHPHVFVVVFAKDTRLVTGLLLPISSYAREGSKAGGFL